MSNFIKSATKWCTQPRTNGSFTVTIVYLQINNKNMSINETTIIWWTTLCRNSSLSDAFWVSQ